jgi:Bacterial Ig domain
VPIALAGTYSVTNDEYQVNEDTQLVVPARGVLANDSSESDTCVFSTDVTGLDGSLPLDSLGPDGQFQFTPDADFNGATDFTYVLGRLNGSACDSMDQTGTVTITVFEINDPPTVVLDSVCSGGVTVAEDSGGFADAGHCVEMSAFGPPDENSQSFDGWVVSSTNPGLFSTAPAIAPVDGTFGRLSFTPASNANGKSTVTVQGRDGAGTTDGGNDLSDPVQFDITVTPVNDAPSAVADSFFALANRTLNVSAPGVLINDGDIDTPSITAVKASNPAHGVVTLAADGSFSYTPADGYIGPDAFSYRASDGSLTSPARVVTISVSTVPPVNTPTPFPSVAPTTTPTAAPTVFEPTASPDALESLDPGATAPASAAASADGSPEPGATPAPGPSGGEGGLSLPVLLVVVLLALLLGFGAAVYVPKWLQARQAGAPMDEG